MLYVSFNIIFQVFHSNILSKEHCLPFTFQSSKVLLSSKKISSDLLQQQILCRILVPIFILVLHFCCCGKKKHRSIQTWMEECDISLTLEEAKQEHRGKK